MTKVKNDAEQEMTFEELKSKVLSMDKKMDDVISASISNKETIQSFLDTWEIAMAQPVDSPDTREMSPFLKKVLAGVTAFTLIVGASAAVRKMRTSKEEGERD